MIAIVDVGVALAALEINGFFTRAEQEASRQALTAAEQLAVPAVFVHEFRSVLGKTLRGGSDAGKRLIPRLTLDEAAAVVDSADATYGRFVRPLSNRELLEVVERHNVGAYDAAYLALALLVGGKVLTYDQRFLRAAAPTAPQVVVTPQQFLGADLALSS